jgi:hypothetical protein
MNDQIFAKKKFDFRELFPALMCAFLFVACEAPKLNQLGRL